MKFSKTNKQKIILSLTPLIDVLFILIIFFTVSSTFLEQPGIELKLPKAESSEAHTAQKVVVYVDDKEDIFLNNNQVTQDNLAEEVEKLIQAQTDKSVVLRADSSAHHGLIITIMDGLRKRGIYKIVVSTVKPIN